MFYKHGNSAVTLNIFIKFYISDVDQILLD